MDDQAVPSTSHNIQSTTVTRPQRTCKIFALSHSADLEELVCNTLFEDSDEDVDDSDQDPDYEEESQHDSESEQEWDDQDEENIEECHQNVDPELPQQVIRFDVDEGVSRDVNNEECREEIHLPNVDAIIEEVIREAMENEPRISRRGDQTFFYGRRNKNMVKKNLPAFKWRKQRPPQNVRTRRENIVTRLPGLRPTATNLGANPDAEAVWNLLFTPDILNEILQWTNVKINQVKGNYAQKNISYVHEIDLIELKGFIGLLVYSAVFKSGNESVLSLFATDGTGREVFRCTMSKERFLFLLQVLRFDNPEDRQERKQDEAAAAISKIFYKFIENCQACYTPGAYLCVDEMLTPFRGRCAFRMYMPNKPAKYGLKIQCLTDAKTHYLFNAYIYTGKDSDGQTLPEEEKHFSKPTQAVLRLVQPLTNTGRNVTTDNWYSSLELANELLKKNLTILGTLKKNKIEIPIGFLPDKEKEVNTSLYGFTENLTLLSHVPKKTKAVIVLSSMHHREHIDLDTGKPELIADYNKTKGGVDTVDQMCANYSTMRRTKRWPMTIFFTMLNIAAGVNGYILHQSYQNTPTLSRLDFMKSLAKSLVSPLMQRRLTVGYIGQDLVLSIRRILQIEDEQPQREEHFFEKRKTCSFCPPRLKRKTKYPCKICNKAICLECARKICVECFRKVNKM